MIDKWQLLLAQLEVIESPLGWEIWTDEELHSFEDETGIILPAEYKNFCQVLGTRHFGKYIRIYCPNLNISKAEIQGLKYIIDRFPRAVSSKKTDIESLKKQLDSAFIFGGAPDADILFWDLKSYSIDDKSYDILLTKGNFLEGELYKVGRDFYEFVCNFCLGMKGWKILPKAKRPSPEDIARTFTRGSLKWLNDNYPNLRDWIN